MDSYIKGLKLILILLLFTISALGYADNNLRVARISFIQGTSIFLPEGETTWVKTILNRPMVVNDSIWTNKNSIVELQFESMLLYLDENTNLKILNLHKNLTQLRLSQGTIIIRIAKILRNHNYEVNTPNLAFNIYRPGTYIIEVNKNTTSITVKEGRAEAFGIKTRQKMHTNTSCTFGGTNLDPYECKKNVAPRKFEQWVQMRNTTQSSRYVSDATIGYQDLDKYGRWSSVAEYGRVWIADSLPANWAPYTQGRWIWIKQWGWTWVDDAPWGFAPFHYGRWAYVNTTWVWVPGPIDVAPYYAPALVVFVGTPNEFARIINTPAIGWFALAPGEIYIPPFRVTQDYFIVLNSSNTIINQTNIINIYHNPKTNIIYKNESNPDSITVVSTQTFTSQEPVEDNILPVSKEEIEKMPKEHRAKVTPSINSVLGEVIEIPAIPDIDKSFVAKNPPAKPTLPFNELQSDTAKGVPFDKEPMIKEDESAPDSVSTPVEYETAPTVPEKPATDPVSTPVEYETDLTYPEKPTTEDLNSQPLPQAHDEFEQQRKGETFEQEHTDKQPSESLHDQSDEMRIQPHPYPIESSGEELKPEETQSTPTSQDSNLDDTIQKHNEVERLKEQDLQQIAPLPEEKPDTTQAPTTLPNTSSDIEPSNKENLHRPARKLERPVRGQPRENTTIPTYESDKNRGVQPINQKM